MSNQKPIVSDTAVIESFERPRYKRKLEAKKHIVKETPILKTYVCDILFASNSVKRSLFSHVDEVGQWLENSCENDPILAVYIDAEIIYCHPTLQVEAEKVRKLLLVTL